jgi:hypothetical protein
MIEVPRSGLGAYYWNRHCVRPARQVGGPKNDFAISRKYLRAWPPVRNKQFSAAVHLAPIEPPIVAEGIGARFTGTERYSSKPWSIGSSSGSRPDRQPASIVMKAPDEFKDKMTAPNELWLTASLSRSRRLLGSTCPRLGGGTQASAPRDRFEASKTTPVTR